MSAYNYGSIHDRTSYAKAIQEAKEEYEQWLADEAQRILDQKATRNIFRKIARGEYGTH